MTRRTFEEKVNYNEQRVEKSDFSAGYTFATYLYSQYPRLDASGKKLVQLQFDTARDGLRSGQAKLKDAKSDVAVSIAQAQIDYNKGMLCGMRDAAANRKKHTKPFSSR